MPSDLYWIDADVQPRLAIMARPRAGDWLEDEVAHWKRSGVGVVVSLLEPDEIEDLGLMMEAVLCEESGIQYLSFNICLSQFRIEESPTMRAKPCDLGRILPRRAGRSPFTAEQELAALR